MTVYILGEREKGLRVNCEKCRLHINRGERAVSDGAAHRASEGKSGVEVEAGELVGSVCASCLLECVKLDGPGRWRRSGSCHGPTNATERTMRVDESPPGLMQLGSIDRETSVRTKREQVRTECVCDYRKGSFL